MDVTQSVNNTILQMGGSGTTNPAYAASSKSLNYAKGSQHLAECCY